MIAAFCMRTRLVLCLNAGMFYKIPGSVAADVISALFSVLCRGLGSGIQMLSLYNCGLYIARGVDF